jgi:hypothetical protein
VDWGPLELVSISDGDDFWALLHELVDDASTFLQTRSSIAEAYKAGTLYSLRMNETDSMYKRGARTDEVFAKGTCYLLPCFCIAESDKAVIIWTHTRARRMGFAKQLVELLNITEASMPLPSSISFGNHVTSKLINHKGNFLHR